MARIKRHRNTQSYQEIKHRCRKPNISKLVYKFLVADQTAHDTERALATKCHYYNQEERDEVVHCADTLRTTGEKMSHRVRRNGGKVSKSRGVKRSSNSKDLPISYLQKCVGGEGTRKARKYIKKALDFGIESGFLIPSDPTYKVLRVSSNLMKSDSRRKRINMCNKALSKEHGTPTRLEDLQVQEQRRRQRRRRRRGRASRSPSRPRKGRRRRGRRRSRSRRSRSRSGGRGHDPQNPEEVVEDEVDDYEMDENDPKSNVDTGDVEREPNTARLNEPDEEELTKKVEDNGSDLSVDEDETDDEEEKKITDTTKS